MEKIHAHWLLEDKKIENEKPKDKKTLHDYSYRELSSALKRFLGRDDNYCVIYKIQGPDVVSVLFEKRWFNVYLEQLRIYLK